MSLFEYVRRLLGFDTQPQYRHTLRKATVEFDTDKTQCADDTLGQVTRSRVMVVKCSPDTCA